MDLLGHRSDRRVLRSGALRPTAPGLPRLRGVHRAVPRRGQPRQRLLPDERDPHISARPGNGRAPGAASAGGKNETPPATLPPATAPIEPVAIPMSPQSPSPWPQAARHCGPAPWSSAPSTGRPAAPVAVPVVTAAQSARARLRGADPNPTASRGILLMIIGLIGVGLLALILRTPREEPLTIIHRPVNNVEPLRKPQASSPDETRASVQRQRERERASLPERARRP